MKEFGTSLPIDVYKAATYLRDWFPDDVVFIGGFAVNAHCFDTSELGELAKFTHDLDAFISRAALIDLSDLEVIVSNKRLSKSQFSKYDIEVDLYIEGKSSLAIDYDEIRTFSQIKQGFRVACLEHLLVLKSHAWHDRAHSQKGNKDEMDICLIVLGLSWQSLRIDLLVTLLPGFAEKIRHICSIKNYVKLHSGNSFLANRSFERVQDVIARLSDIHNEPPLPSL